MDQEQSNRTTMFNTVVTYMDNNNAIWTPMTAMGDTVTDVKAGIAVIDDKMERQTTPITGEAEEKGDVRGNLEDAIAEIGDQLASLASAAHDADMAAQVNFTLPALRKLAADDLEATGKRVSGLATANLAALAGHLIVQADVTALDALVVAFHKLKTAPRTAISQRAGETKTLPDAINHVTGLLRDRLDKQMSKFRKKNPEFYAGYQTARVIVDRGGSGGPQVPPINPTTTPSK